MACRPRRPAPERRGLPVFSSGVCLGGKQRIDGAKPPAIRGVEQRCAAGGIAGVHVRASGQQCGHDLDMARLRGFVQGAASARIPRIDPGLVLEQQQHAGGIVLLAARGGEQRRRCAVDLGLGAALQQEPRQAPVAGGAGDAQRGHPVAIAHVEFGRRIAQQRSDAGI